MSADQRFIIALVQLAMLALGLVAVVFLAVEHALQPGATVTLITVVITHVGVIAYNGATKAGERRFTDGVVGDK